MPKRSSLCPNGRPHAHRIMIDFRWKSRYISETVALMPKRSSLCPNGRPYAHGVTIDFLWKSRCPGKPSLKCCKVRGKNVSFGQKNIGCKIECTCEISENWNRGITVKWINALIYWWDICFPNIVDYDLLDLPTKHWRSSKRWSKESACSSRVVCILWIYEWLYYV